MAEDTGLAAFLKTQRNNNAPCWCEDAPKDIVAQVDAALAGGSTQWTAMQKWLADQLGHSITRLSLTKHRDEGHRDG